MTPHGSTGETTSTVATSVISPSSIAQQLAAAKELGRTSPSLYQQCIFYCPFPRRLVVSVEADEGRSWRFRSTHSGSLTIDRTWWCRQSTFLSSPRQPQSYHWTPALANNLQPSPIHRRLFEQPPRIQPSQRAAAPPQACHRATRLQRKLESVRHRWLKPQPASQLQRPNLVESHTHDGMSTRVPLRHRPRCQRRSTSHQHGTSQFADATGFGRHA